MERIKGLPEKYQQRFDDGLRKLEGCDDNQVDEIVEELHKLFYDVVNDGHHKVAAEVYKAIDYTLVDLKKNRRVKQLFSYSEFEVHEEPGWGGLGNENVEADVEDDNEETEQFIVELLESGKIDEMLNHIFFLSQENYDNQSLSEVIASGIKNLLNSDLLEEIVQEKGFCIKNMELFLKELKKAILVELDPILSCLFECIDEVFVPVEKTVKSKQGSFTRCRSKAKKIESKALRIMVGLAEMGVKFERCDFFDAPRKEGSWAKDVVYLVILEEQNKTLLFNKYSEGMIFVLPSVDHELFSGLSKSELKEIDGVCFMRDVSDSAELWQKHLNALVNSDFTGDRKDLFLSDDPREILAILEGDLDENNVATVGREIFDKHGDVGVEKVKLQYLELDHLKGRFYINGIYVSSIHKRLVENGVQPVENAIYVNEVGSAYNLYLSEDVELFSLRLDANGTVDIKGRKALGVYNYCAANEISEDWLRMKIEKAGLKNVWETVKCVVQGPKGPVVVSDENIFWLDEVEPLLPHRVDATGVAAVDGVSYVNLRKYLEYRDISYKTFLRLLKKESDVKPVKDGELEIWVGSNRIEPYLKSEIDKLIEKYSVELFLIEVGGDGVAEKDDVEYIAVNYYDGLNGWSPQVLRKWLKQAGVEAETEVRGSVNGKMCFLYRRDVVDRIIESKPRKD